MDSVSLYQAVGFASLVNLLLVILTSRRGPWSAAAAYSSVLWVFHFGLIVVLGFSLRAENELSVYVQSWVFSAAAREAGVLSLIGAIACAVGIHLGTAIRFWHRNPYPSRPVDRRFQRLVSTIGAVLLAAAVAAWFGIVLSIGGWSLLTGSYRNYLTATAAAGSIISLIWLILAVGLIIVAAAEPSAFRRIGMAFFAIFVIFAGPLGLRGEILFPLVAAAAVRAKQGRSLRPGTTLIAVSLVLVVISIGRNVREVGISGVQGLEYSASVWDGLSELGGSLQPVQKVVAWRDAGDQYLRGASYWAPFERAIARFVPGIERLPAREDMRIMNVLVVAKGAGPIGFSPVAEAFRNFGATGVIGVMFVIGVILAKLDQLPPIGSNHLIAGGVLVPLLINVRNSFVFVPFYIAFVGALVLVVRALTWRVDSDGRNSRLPATSLS